MNDPVIIRSIYSIKRATVDKTERVRQSIAITLKHGAVADVYVDDLFLCSSSIEIKRISDTLTKISTSDGRLLVEAESL